MRSASPSDPTKPLRLSGRETKRLRVLAYEPRGRVALRARMILALAAGEPLATVAQTLGVGSRTVIRWRGRFARHRIDGLLDRPRSGAPRRVDAALIERVAALSLDGRRRPRARSSRAIARLCGVSQTTIVRVWHALALTQRGTTRTSDSEGGRGS